MRTQSRWVVTAVLWLADALVMRSTTTAAIGLPAQLSRPHVWIAAVGADRAAQQLATTALWLTSLWLTAALAIAALCAVPGTAGRMSRRLATRTLPRALRVLIVGSIGASVVLVPSPAGAEPNGCAVAPTVSTTADRCVGTTSARRSMVVAVTGSHTRAGRSTGAGAATTESRTVPWPRAVAHSAPSRYTTGSTGGTAPTIGWPSDRPTSDTEVTVRAGDSLWLIAARRLGPRATDTAVARSWPAWYQANHRVIGDDPNHIVAGQRLHPPIERGTS